MKAVNAALRKKQPQMPLIQKSV